MGTRRKAVLMIAVLGVAQIVAFGNPLAPLNYGTPECSNTPVPNVGKQFWPVTLTHSANPARGITVEYTAAGGSDCDVAAGYGCVNCAKGCVWDVWNGDRTFTWNVSSNMSVDGLPYDTLDSKISITIPADLSLPTGYSVATGRYEVYEVVNEGGCHYASIMELVTS